MKLDLHTVPFSRAGSYLAFSVLPAAEKRGAGLYLRSVHGEIPAKNRFNEVLLVEVLADGQPVPYTVTATPTHLHLQAEAGFVEICLAAPDLVRFRGQGVGVRWSKPPERLELAFPDQPPGWILNSYPRRMQYGLLPLQGELHGQSNWRNDRADYIRLDFCPDAEGRCEGLIQEFESVWQRQTVTDSFEHALAYISAEWQAWLAALPPVPPEFQVTAELAAYVQWSALVRPVGYLTRPTMLMSKNWMTSVWSWDHCFNAMALAVSQPALAWDQLLLFFDHQNEAGILPDFLNDRLMIWNFVKPPIHGWAMAWMLRHSEAITNEQLATLYPPLIRWTAWWFTYRDSDGDGIPQYNTGNDGWDNCTVFEIGPPVEAPDLTAFLILQMECIAAIADRLNRPDEADHWRQQAVQLLARLIEHSWRGEQFVAPRSGDHALTPNADSVYPFLALVLGPRLPPALLQPLVAGLTAPDRFLTEHGFATESVSSPYYLEDGYWRGPIWAPSTLILVDGLHASGHIELAQDIARRFCRMVAANGMAENFDARTGAGLRDRAYTWTASVFLILAAHYLPGGADA